MKRRFSSALLAAMVTWTLLACGWSATSVPNGTRYYDERFSVWNVTTALETGSLRPQNAWYSRLSYLPQALALGGLSTVAGWTGSEQLQVLGEGRTMTPLGYVVARLFSVVFGAISVLLTYIVGSRLFSRAVGLLGASFLLLSPWLLRSFVIFKADALLLAVALATFLWSLRAVERPTWRSYAVAGVGVGLAASAKYTGALIALPLAVGTALVGRDLLGHFRRLALAGAVSLAVFLALHPYVGFYLSFFRRSLRVYSTKDTQGFFEMLLSESAMLLHWSFHGPVIGALALVGLAALSWRLYRLRREEAPFRRLAMFLSFPLGYSAVYAVVTSLPKGNNYLVLLPFTSLAAAWVLVAVWERLAARLGRPARRLIFWPALAALLVFEVWPANRWLYGESVPRTTLAEAGEVIRRATFLRQRTAVYEADVGTLDTLRRGEESLSFVHAREVPLLSEVPEEELDLVDFEVFQWRRLSGPDRDFYLRRLTRPWPSEARVVDPRWFRVRGERQLVLLRPWSPDGPAVPVEWTAQRTRKGRFRGRLDESLRRGDVVSIALLLPDGELGINSVTVGERTFSAIHDGYDERGHWYMTERFRLAWHGLPIELQLDEKWTEDEPPDVEVWRWRQPPGLQDRG